MKKRKTIITVTVLILVLLVVILLSLRGCTSESVDPSEEEATEASTEEPSEKPTEEPTEESTEKPTEESTGCRHVWQEIFHEEISHKQKWFTCMCGARFKAVEDWRTHVNGIDGEYILDHASWHKEYDIIVDTPAYSTWYCSKCGETRDTQP